MIEPLFHRPSLNLFGAVALVGVLAAPALLCAQQGPSRSRLSVEADKAPRRTGPRQTATIHWQGVTLAEAIARLKPLFDEPVFLDRRIDPNQRVSLDIEATSAEQVLSALAAEHELGVGR